MKHRHSQRTTWFTFSLAAITLAAGLRPGLAAPPSDDHPAAGSTTHSHSAMQPVPRLQPKRVVTVTGNEDWESQRGFGKDAAMAEMMTLMMVGGSGMEHMKMAPMKKGSTQPWSQPAGPKASQPAGPQVTLITPADKLKIGKNALEFTILDAAGKPVTGAKVTTAVAMTNMDMGTAHPPAREGKDGRYTTEVEFSMKGPWRVTLVVTPPNGKLFTRSFAFNVNE